MAIYHFSAQVISRGRGQSAVASAAYRSGDRLIDERTSEGKYYHRDVKPDTMILAPSNSPKWVQDRNRLWNEVEKSEVRKNSQLAREVNIALPVELSAERQKELIQNYVQKEFVDKGMVADIAIHRDDPNNPHAHVMLTTREISEQGFTVKNRDWNNRELLNQWREQWANYANRTLEREGVQERISHLSHEARGLEQLPTIHLGHVAHEMEKKGIETERGNINREHQEYNRLVVDLQKYREEKRALEQKKEQWKHFSPAEKTQVKEAAQLLKTYATHEKVNERLEQLDRWEQSLSKQEGYLNWKDGAFKEASRHYRIIENNQKEIEGSRKRIADRNLLNPLKFRENKFIKEQELKNIERYERTIESHNKSLDHFRNKLGFTDKDFEQKFESFQGEKQRLGVDILKKRTVIKEQRETLVNAKQAFEKATIREVANQYPNWKEAKYLTYANAQKIKDFNDKAQKIVPLDEIKKTYEQKVDRIEKLTGGINHIGQEKNRLRTVESYLNGFEKWDKEVKKFENNPFLKGKRLISPKTEEQYQKALSERNNFKDRMNDYGVKDRNDFNHQVDKIGGLEKEKPKLEKAISQEKNGAMGTNILDEVLKAINQASKTAEREQQLAYRQRNRTQKQIQRERYSRER